MGKRSGAKPIAAALDYFKRAKKRPGRRESSKKMDYELLEHALIGDVRPGRPTGSGSHFRPGGNDFDGRRIRPGTERPVGDKGVYEAEPEFYDPDLGWKRKGGNNGVSTYFPKDWSAKDVDHHISTAFRNSKRDPNNPNQWIGESGGVKITGYYNNNNGTGYTHGFPHANQ